MMRSLITGIDGFIGSALAEKLKSQGNEVFGISRKECNFCDGIQRFCADMTDSGAILEAVRDSRPDRVFHLAAQNNIAESFGSPQSTMNVNLAGSIHLFDAILKHASQAKIVSVGSSSEYGNTAALHKFISEDVPLLPTSPYGISKAALSMLSRVYASALNLHVLHVRPFAIIGPRKKRDALSEFSQGVVEIEQGVRNFLYVGDISTIRDFIDIRDCVDALVLLSEKGKAGEIYNLCNARGTSMEEMLEILKKCARKPVITVTDHTRLRLIEDHRIVGDNTKLKALGYAPVYELRDTIQTTLDYWRPK